MFRRMRDDVMVKQIAAFLSALAAVVALGGCPAYESESSYTQSGADETPALDNLHAIGEDVFVGGEPKDEDAFADLKGMGIRTIVSVDGIMPDLDAAQIGRAHV